MRAHQIHEDFQNSVSKIGPKPWDQNPVGKDNGAAPLNVEGGNAPKVSKNNRHKGNNK